MTDSHLLYDGRLERARFHPLLAALLGLVLAFVLFQGISTITAIFMLVFVRGVGLDALLTDLPAVLEQYAGDLIVGNTVGQVFGLLLPGIWFARLHSSTWPAFLRLRGTDARFLVLSLLGLLAIIPVVQVLGSWSDLLPWPDSIRAFEKQQMDLIERILMRDFPLAFSISMLALTPAICEEVLFRGYVQRQAERSLGIFWGIAFSGIVFGLYHLRLTQALPLSVLGIFLAWITWRSGSLIPAILVHLANNSFAAILGKMSATGQLEADLETFEMPMSIFFVSLVVLVVVILAMNRIPTHGEEPYAEKTEDR
ncbi:MAG: CPBP family intramembrane glutamic endopeptidase [Rhodothermales bacterium]